MRPADKYGLIEAVEHLLGLGHTRVAFIGGIEGVGTGVPRIRTASLVRWTHWKEAEIPDVWNELMALPQPRASRPLVFY